MPDDAIEPLRDARRSFTRQRIAAAAREVFAQHGLQAATMEQIAAAAGTRRSTLYNHFRDKEEILAAIAQSFGEGLVRLIERLPSPDPTRAEIDRWVREIAAFSVEERTPTILLMQLGLAVEAPPVVQHFGLALMQALADRLPAFAQAIEPGPDHELVQARASVVLRQIGSACATHMLGEDEARAEAMLTVAAELFARFIEEHR